MKDESPDSQRTGDDSTPPGDDDNTESPNSGKDTQAKANAKCALAFAKDEEGRRSAKKKRKHATSAKTAKTLNKQNNRTPEPPAPPKDDRSKREQEDYHAAGASGKDRTNTPETLEQALLHQLEPSKVPIVNVCD